MWDWIANGDLTLQQFRDFARMYYQHVRVYRLYLAGAMTIMPQEELQVALADIIADEFGLATSSSMAEETCSHPELFRRFMRSLGLTAAEWDRTQSVLGIEMFRQTHYSLFRLGLVEETIGAIVFACENATPYRHSRVAAGIQKFNEVNHTSVDPSFFTSHVTLDVHHSESLMRPIAPLLEKPETVERIRRGIVISCDARKLFLDDLSRRLGQEALLFKRGRLPDPISSAVPSGT